MNDKVKQLWWDIQHYGEILGKINKSVYGDFYTEQTHKYQDKIYKSIMLNGECIALFRLYEYNIYSYVDDRYLFDRKYWLPAGLEIVDTIGEEK